MSIDVKDKNHVDELLKVIADLESKEIDVGVLGKSPAEIKMIAGVQEFGCDINVTSEMRGYLAAAMDVHLKKSTTRIRIPERSFIRSGYDTNKNDIEDQGKKLIKSVVDFSITPDQAAETLGEIAKGMIRDFAVDLSDPPNSDITIEQKGSSNPLVGKTNKLIDSIDYEVVRR